METSAIDSSLQQSVSLQPDRITTVAREFESLFSSMMLKAMRKTVGDNTLIPLSMGEKIYTEMLDDEYAKMIGDNGSLGLAGLIEKELRRNEGTPVSMGKTAPPSWMYEKGMLPSAVQSYQPITIDYAQVAQRVEKWNGLITEISNEYAVDKNLVAAVVAQESAGNQYAVSRAGAKGLMQLMDTTARQMGVTDSFDPAGNIVGGVKYLRRLLDTFDGNVQLALAAYNAGPGAVDKYNGIPPYRETREYVASVLTLRKQFENASFDTAAKE
jgi:Rod binding domain-containing protein